MNTILSTGFRSFTEVSSLNPEGFLRNLRREGTPDRVYFIELFQDREIEAAVDSWFRVTAGLDRNARDFEWRRRIAMQRFLGYEYVPVGLLKLELIPHHPAPDTAPSEQTRGDRGWLEEHRGVITSWEEFEKYPWPDGRSWDTRELEWYERHLPDDMILVGREGHFCEYLCWLMGYETACLALYDQPELVQALVDRILNLEMAATHILLQCPRVRIIWASDDLGFKTGLLFGPDFMRRYALKSHKQLAALSHQHGRLYLLHACGRRADILEDLIEDVRVDGLHSWEDAIEPVTEAKPRYGHRVSLLGGVDMDFLCRASEAEVRRRVRETLEICQPGGGYCLGTGNTVANYIPLGNYLAMLDEGRMFS